jgi:hypothetical protein
MKGVWTTCAVLVAALAFCATPALASTTIGWGGTGGDNLPCSGNEHWVLAPAQGVTSATLTIDGVDYVMSQSGQGSFAVDTDVGFDGSQSVSVTYEGDNDQAHLQLSHCDSGETTGGETTAGETTAGETTAGETTAGETTAGETTAGETTAGETTAGETTAGETTAGETTGGSAGGTTGSGGVSGATGGTTGGTSAAPSGGSLPFTGLPMWIPLLVAAGLLVTGVALLRRRPGEVS